MKQWITEEQFNELTNEQKEVWYKWIRDHHYTFGEIYTHILTRSYPKWTTLNFPSIGEMIEFLGEDQFNNFIDEEYCEYRIGENFKGNFYQNINIEGFCDALWEAVKEVLAGRGL